MLLGQLGFFPISVKWPMLGISMSAFVIAETLSQDLRNSTHESATDFCSFEHRFGSCKRQA
jgi:hypothetical protein